MGSSCSENTKLGGTWLRSVTQFPLAELSFLQNQLEPLGIITFDCAAEYYLAGTAFDSKAADKHTCMRQSEQCATMATQHPLEIES
jgi:hypothetical protein